MRKKTMVPSHACGAAGHDRNGGQREHHRARSVQTLNDLRSDERSECEEISHG
jgi:hypothetical protein